MRHSFTLIILACSAGAGEYSWAIDRSAAYNVASDKVARDKAELALKFY